MKYLKEEVMGYLHVVYVKKEKKEEKGEEEQKKKEKRKNRLKENKFKYVF